MQKVKVGLPVVVTVDAVQEKMFTGKVVKIAMLPDAQMVWLNPDLKIYSTEIHLDEDGTGLRTGMSCRASIVVDQYEDVVYIPVQAVVRIGDQPTAYVMKEGKTEPRKVEIGLDNNRMVHVISGLEPGEEVILTPPLAPAEAQEAKARDALRQKDAPDMPGGESGGREPRGRPGPPGRRTPAGPRDT
ncbi:MAG: hypothetical protein JSW59_00200 [Phycisphaerales bacterium]|nr:MAG: hypothetical protein JSW59_00200 [Phycisphaerales bacterium]